MGTSIDLHSHTTVSDGLLSPRELVAKAAQDGVTTLAVTDHDTLDGLAESQAAGAEHGVRIVPGIELSVTHEGTDFHVLGLFVDPAEPALAGLLESRRQDRVARVHQTLEKLDALGVGVTFEQVLEYSGEEGVMGRPHIARAIVAAGHAGSTDEVFARWLKNGGPAHIPYPKLSSEEGIAAVLAAGGVASLAHPAIDDGDGKLESFKAAGIDAVEVWHPSHNPSQVRHFTARAAELELLCSGGSDFHGTGKKHSLTLGTPGCPVEAFEALEDLARTRAQR
ncbi:MAG: PHP domain-containing protein [Planctomycetota bacterium]|jgi:predicted metal-dependent phosphoesterase TrpH